MAATAADLLVINSLAMLCCASRSSVQMPRMLRSRKRASCRGYVASCSKSLAKERRGDELDDDRWTYIDLHATPFFSSVYFNSASSVSSIFCNVSDFH